MPDNKGKPHFSLGSRRHISSVLVGVVHEACWDLILCEYLLEEAVKLESIASGLGDHESRVGRPEAYVTAVRSVYYLSRLQKIDMALLWPALLPGSPSLRHLFTRVDTPGSNNFTVDLADAEATGDFDRLAVPRVLWAAIGEQNSNSPAHYCLDMLHSYQYNNPLSRQESSPLVEEPRCLFLHIGRVHSSAEGLSLSCNPSFRLRPSRLEKSDE